MINISHPNPKNDRKIALTPKDPSYKFTHSRAACDTFLCMLDNSCNYSLYIIGNYLVSNLSIIYVIKGYMFLVKMPKKPQNSNPIIWIAQNILYPFHTRGSHITFMVWQGQKRSMLDAGQDGPHCCRKRFTFTKKLHI